MPRLTKSPPKYRKHRASGQAIVPLDGCDFYLGPHGTKTSQTEYDRLIGEWLANGRRLRASAADEPSPITVVELCAAFLARARQHYTKHGRPTAELAGMKICLRYLKGLYGDIDIAKFRPLCLAAIQQKVIQAGNSRGYINQNTGRIKHIFKWGVSKELVLETTHRALLAVDQCRRHRRVSCICRPGRGLHPTRRRRILVPAGRWRWPLDHGKRHRPAVPVRVRQEHQ